MSQRRDRLSFQAWVPEGTTAVTANHVPSFMPRDATTEQCACSAICAIEVKRRDDRRQNGLLSKVEHDMKRENYSDLFAERQKPLKFFRTSQIQKVVVAATALRDIWLRGCIVPITRPHGKESGPTVDSSRMHAVGF